MSLSLQIIKKEYQVLKTKYNILLDTINLKRGCIDAYYIIIDLPFLFAYTYRCYGQMRRFMNSKGKLQIHEIKDANIALIYRGVETMQKYKEFRLIYFDFRLFIYFNAMALMYLAVLYYKHRTKESDREEESLIHRKSRYDDDYEEDLRFNYNYANNILEKKAYKHGFGISPDT